MEIFGGFMVMLSIIGFFLTVIWFLIPFVIFSIKGRTDRILQTMEEMDQRLKLMEEQLSSLTAAPEADVISLTDPVQEVSDLPPEE
jgi:hypothetical protein